MPAGETKVSHQLLQEYIAQHQKDNRLLRQQLEQMHKQLVQLQRTAKDPTSGKVAPSAPVIVPEVRHQSLIETTDMNALQAANFAATQISHMMQTQSSAGQHCLFPDAVGHEDVPEAVHFSDLLVVVQTISDCVDYKMLIEVKDASDAETIQDKSTTGTGTVRWICWVDVRDRVWNGRTRHHMKLWSHLQKIGGISTSAIASDSHIAPDLPEVKLSVAAACHQLVKKAYCLPSNNSTEHQLCHTLIQFLQKRENMKHIKTLWAKKKASGGTMYEILLEISAHDSASNDESTSRKKSHRQKAGPGRANNSGGGKTTRKKNANAQLLKCQMFLPLQGSFDQLRLLTADLVHNHVEVESPLSCFYVSIEKSRLKANLDPSEKTTNAGQEAHREVNQHLQQQFDALQIRHVGDNKIWSSKVQILEDEVRKMRAQMSKTSPRALQMLQERSEQKDVQLQQSIKLNSTLQSKLDLAENTNKQLAAKRSILENSNRDLERKLQIESERKLQIESDKKSQLCHLESSIAQKLEELQKLEAQLLVPIKKQKYLCAQVEGLEKDVLQLEQIKKAKSQSLAKLEAQLECLQVSSENKSKTVQTVHHKLSIENQNFGELVQFVRLEHSKQYLHVSSVQVYDNAGENVALVSKGAAASASSVGWKGNNSFPIDGQKRTDWPSGCHTKNSANEWWEVRLAKPTAVAKITVCNRLDAAAERLKGARVVLLNGNRVVVPMPSPMLLTADRDPQHFFIWSADPSMPADGDPPDKESTTAKVPVAIQDPSSETTKNQGAPASRPGAAHFEVRRMARVEHSKGDSLARQNEGAKMKKAGHETQVHISKEHEMKQGNISDNNSK
jgi:hypothetical protein